MADFVLKSPRASIVGGADTESALALETAIAAAIAATAESGDRESSGSALSVKGKGIRTSSGSSFFSSLRHSSDRDFVDKPNPSEHRDSVDKPSSPSEQRDSTDSDFQSNSGAKSKGGWGLGQAVLGRMRRKPKTTSGAIGAVSPQSSASSGGNASPESSVDSASMEAGRLPFRRSTFQSGSKNDSFNSEKGSECSDDTDGPQTRARSSSNGSKGQGRYILWGIRRDDSFQQSIGRGSSVTSDKGSGASNEDSKECSGCSDRDSVESTTGASSDFVEEPTAQKPRRRSFRQMLGGGS